MLDEPSIEMKLLHSAGSDAFPSKEAPAAEYQRKVIIKRTLNADCFNMK